VTTSWFILQIIPQQERRAEEALRKLGYESFTPVEIKRRKMRRGAGRKREWEYPIFVGYAFAGIDGETLADCYEGLHHIKSSLSWREPGGMFHNVLGWRHDRRPYVMRQEQVEYLHSVSGKSLRYVGSINPHKAVVPPQVGGQARILEGHYLAAGDEERIVTVSEIRPATRKHPETAIVTVQMLGGMVPVPIPTEFLEAV